MTTNEREAYRKSLVTGRGLRAGIQATVATAAAASTAPAAADTDAIDTVSRA